MAKANHNQLKAMAVIEFIDHMISAFDSGFIDSHELNLATAHRVAENYAKDRYSENIHSIEERWGTDIAQVCKAGFEKNRAGKVLDLTKKIKEARELSLTLKRDADFVYRLYDHYHPPKFCVINIKAASANTRAEFDMCEKGFITCTEQSIFNVEEIKHMQNHIEQWLHS